VGLTGCNEAPLSIVAKFCDSAREEFVLTSERSVSMGRGESTVIQASVNCISCGGGTFCWSGRAVARAGGLYSTMGSNKAPLSIGAKFCDSPREELVLTSEMGRGELTAIQASVNCISCGGGTFCWSGLYSTGAGLTGSNEALFPVGAEICDSTREEFVLTGESMGRGELTTVQLSVDVLTGGAEGCAG